MQREWSRGAYSISSARERIDLGVVHGYLRRSYWAPDRSRERVAQSVDASLPFGLYRGEEQVGFARVVTDYVTIAFLADVFVLEEHRGQGLGVWLVDVVTSLPELQRVRRWLLGTRDAHDLYRKFSFSDLPRGALMQRLDVESDRDGEVGTTGEGGGRAPTGIPTRIAAVRGGAALRRERSVDRVRRRK